MFIKLMSQNICSFSSKKTFKREFDKCAYSGEKFEPCDCATIEHILPVSLGGKDDYSNYLVVKHSWNADRKHMALDEYIRENPSVKDNIVSIVNSKQGKIIEGIDWSTEVSKTLKTVLGYDIFS